MNLRKTPFVLLVVGIVSLVFIIFSALSAPDNSGIGGGVVLFFIMAFLISSGLILAGVSFIILDIVRNKRKSLEPIRKVPSWLIVIVLLVMLALTYFAATVDYISILR